MKTTLPFRRLSPFFLAALLAFQIKPTRAMGSQVVQIHLPAVVSKMKLPPLRQLSGSKRLSLAIGLPWRDREALTNLLHQIYDPASPNYHHYLTPGQFTAKFGPTKQDYQAVIAFAKANGLTVSATSPNRMLLDVKGTAAAIEKALHITLLVYQHPNEARTFYAPSSEPSLDLSVPVLGISGLDNYSLPRPHVVATPLNQLPKAAPNSGSGPEGSYMGHDFRAAYIPGSSLDGSGQKVGLLQFDGYTASDIAYYESQAGLPSVTLTNVLLDGYNGVPTGNGGEVEVSLDIEMAISMAPGLDAVMVYEAGPNGDWHDILNRMATDDLAKQLSCSWYIPGGGPDPVADQIFQQMALQGQSFFNASGDYGAYTGPIDFPGDTPYITQVGGTTLTTSGPGGDWVSEAVWNWTNGIASGGGISTSYPIPSWQARVSMALNHGSATMRDTPDVALTADNIYVRADDTDYNAGGTSCAAPLWAGFAALINQQAAANGRGSVGFINPALYALGGEAAYTMGLHDITTGSNSTPFSPASTFPAVPGYDLCTGWGTPNGTNLINALVPPVDDLQISPGLGFAADGPPGGPFQPASESYSLKNIGATVLNWALASTSAWLTVSSSAGLLKPGGPAGAVEVGLNSEATNLPVGSYNATVWFTNLNSGFVQSRQYLLRVANQPVVITQQPTNQSLLAGETATFSVQATGTRVAYYWQKNGGTLTNGSRLSGVTSPTLTIRDVTAADADLYSVIVSNRLGSVRSSDAALAVYSPAGGQLVQNGGFETGDFSGWTLSGNTNLTVVSTNSVAVHTGSYGGQSGASGSPAFLSQTLPTSPGAAYAVSVWFDSPDGQMPNQFLVEWNGRVLFSGGNLDALGWTNLQFLVTATGTNTPLVLGFQDDPSYLGLDDVTVAAYTNVASPPILVTPPLSQTVLAGSNVTFSVRATGTLPLSYFWKRDGAFISGANDSDYTLTNAQVSASGSQFSCLVSNSYGTVLSPAGLLTVLQGASNDHCDEAIIIPSANYTNTQSTFNATSSGDPVPDCGSFSNGVWYAYTAPANGQMVVDTVGSDFDTVLASYVGSCGSLVPVGCNDDSGGALTSTLTNLVTQGATYYLLAGGYMGAEGTLVLHLTFTGATNAPIMVAQPTDQDVPVGGTATFTVSVTGASPLNYFWKRNGEFVAGANGSSYTIPNVQTADSGSRFSCLVSNVFGTVISSNALLTVLPANLTNDLCSGAVFISSADYTNTQSTLDATSTGDPMPACAPLSNGVWYAYTAPANGRMAVDTVGSDFDTVLADYVGSCGSLVPIACNDDSGGVLTSSLTNAVTAGMTYYILAGGYDGVAGTLALHFRFDAVATPPTFLVQPTNQIVSTGEKATFTVTATGASPLSYFWKRNGAFISGANDRRYTVTNAQLADSGSTFSCLASNVFGTTLSSNALLSVAALEFTSVALTNNTLSLRWSAARGKSYQLQYTTNLDLSDWVNLGGIITATNGMMSTLDPIASDQQRFYRLVWVP